MILTARKWKSWTDSLDKGTVVDFNEKTMREAGDEIVDQILNLRREVVQVQKKIQQKI
jgi:hypothetical protein